MFAIVMDEMVIINHRQIIRYYDQKVNYFRHFYQNDSLIIHKTEMRWWICRLYIICSLVIINTEYKRLLGRYHTLLQTICRYRANSALSMEANMECLQQQQTNFSFSACIFYEFECVHFSWHFHTWDYFPFLWGVHEHFWAKLPRCLLNHFLNKMGVMLTLFVDEHVFKMIGSLPFLSRWGR